MTYLSLYKLTPRDCRCLRLTDPYSRHRAVLNLFPDAHGRDEGRILWADQGQRGDMRQLLILSPMHPLIGPSGSLEIRQIPNGFLDHEAYRFEVVINPVERSGATGKLRPLVDAASVLQWFCHRSGAWGFTTTEAEVARSWVVSFPKGKSRAVINMARLRGRLRVDDPRGFREAFTQGIGRAKAFGCGLLQLTPIGE